MPSKNSVAVIVALLGLPLAGCGGGDYGIEGAPTPLQVPGDLPDDYRQPQAQPPQRQPMRQALAPQAPRELDSARGPSGTSGVASEDRYDAVGYAGLGEGNAVIGVHRALPPGSFAEVTSLESGKTILIMIADRGQLPSDHEIDLSPAAAQLLGIGGAAVTPVRVRRVDPTPADKVALRAGRAAAGRIDAPPVLIGALRKRLPSSPGSGGRAMPPVRQSTRPLHAQPGPGAAYAIPGDTSARSPAIRAGYYVQVAALSSRSRADALAAEIGGSVQNAGGIYRVRLGPFADPRAAANARDAVASRGYGDARVVQDQ